MTTSAPGQGDAVGVLRELVRTLGFSHVVYLLAQVRDDAARASGAAHDAKVLGETAMRLLG